MTIAGAEVVNKGQLREVIDRTIGIGILRGRSRHGDSFPPSVL